jgi:hypothetical protein
VLAVGAGTDSCFPSIQVKGTTIQAAKGYKLVSHREKNGPSKIYSVLESTDINAIRVSLGTAMCSTPRSTRPC